MYVCMNVRMYASEDSDHDLVSAEICLVADERVRERVHEVQCDGGQPALMVCVYVCMYVCLYVCIYVH